MASKDQEERTQFVFLCDVALSLTSVAWSEREPPAVKLEPEPVRLYDRDRVIELARQRRQGAA